MIRPKFAAFPLFDTFCASSKCSACVHFVLSEILDLHDTPAALPFPHRQPILASNIQHEVQLLLTLFQTDCKT